MGGASSAQGALNQWKGSNGHCKNMMSTGARIFAVGYGYNQGATYRNYWTQMFGSSTAGLNKSCHPAAALRAASEPSETVLAAAVFSPDNIIIGDAWTHKNVDDTNETDDEIH